MDDGIANGPHEPGRHEPGPRVPSTGSCWANEKWIGFGCLLMPTSIAPPCLRSSRPGRPGLRPTGQCAASALERLDAQRAWWAAESAVVQAHLGELCNRVALFKAPGH